MNEEEKQVCVGFREASYVLVNKHGEQVKTLAAGDVIELWIGGGWCRVRVESGGYKGWYYMTSNGIWGRFAVCMHARLVEQVVAAPVVVSPLEQLRLAWVGRAVQSRVPVAGGYVSGVVREITDRGVALFAYTARLNTVPVLARVPVACLDEVLVVIAS